MNVEAEKNELILKNSNGDHAVVPANKRKKVLELINKGNDKAIDRIVEKLPVMEEYAEDGSIYPNEPIIKQGQKGSKKNPIELPEVNATAEAPTYIKYKQEYERENPFNPEDYVKKNYNKITARELGSTNFNPEDRKEKLRQEAREKREEELNEAEKMGLIYQRFNPQSKEDIRIANEQFKKRYGTTPHRYRYDNDPEYKSRIDKQIRNAESEIGYPDSDLRREDVVAPNNMWMYPQLSGESKKQATEFSNKVIEAALPIPGLESMGKVPGAFKVAKSAVKSAGKKINKVTNKGIGKGTRLIPLSKDDYIEDLLKRELERKNTRAAKQGDKYIREIEDPTHIKKLEDFDKRYGTNLKDKTRQFVEDWEQNKIIGGNKKLTVEDVDKNNMNNDYIRRGGNYLNDEGYYAQLAGNTSRPEHYSARISKDIDEGEYEDVVWHELSHSITRDELPKSVRFTEETRDIFKNRLDVEDQVGKSEADYINKPTETWAFLSTNLRKDLKKSGITSSYDEPITVEKLNEAKEKGSTIYNRFEPYIKNKEKFVDLFNKMTLSIAPTASYITSQAEQNKNNK